LIHSFSSKMKGCIFEGHYFAYIQANPFNICLKRSRAPNVPVEEEREFINEEEVKDCEMFSEFLGNFGGKNNVKRFTILNINITTKVHIKGMITANFQEPPDDGSWRFYLPISPNFPAVDGILQGTITDEKGITHEIIILDQVTVSTPKEHCSKKNDVGRMLLTDQLREQKDDEENQRISRKKFQTVFHRVKTTKNCHLFWKWTLKNPDQKVLDSYPLTDLGRTQSTHGPPDGMTAGYVTGK